MSQSELSRNFSSGSDFKENSKNIGFYGEYGLSLFSWDSQVTLYFAQKDIEREADAGDSYRSQGFSDLAFSTNHAIGHMKLGDFDFRLAGIIGGVSAITPKRSRIGEEADPSHELPDNRRFLVSGVDYGRPAWQYGWGSTLSWQSIWWNLSHRLKTGTQFAFAEENFQTSIGSGLPSNSWVQLSYSQLSSSDAILTAAETKKTSILGLSLGYTFYSGFAFEAGISQLKENDSRWETANQIEIGFSHRTL